MSTLKKLPKNNRFSPKTLKTLTGVGLTALTIGLSALVYHSERAGQWFKASVLEAPAAFDGTVLPVLKVPNFTHWSAQNNQTYNQIPESELIDLPAYDLEVMRFPDDKLVWGDSSQDAIRNTKITYPVVYMGNYRFDHMENAGSHLAVDIKIPSGTPIRSIANGRVVKTSMQSTGFGHHVVIKHSGVPDPDHPGKTTTLYSAFNHLDRIDVAEGQNVTKGQLIGTSGNTGTSTTPHLHFQIDRDSAPWHPYWPFSSKESQEAGLSFFEAVNAGLGLDRGRENTVNPMEFVMRYRHYTPSGEPADTVDDSPPVEDKPPAADPPADENGPPANYEAPSLEQPSIFLETGSSKLFKFSIKGESASLTNNAVTLLVTDTGNQLDQIDDDEPIDVEITGVGQTNKKQLFKSNFSNGTAKLIIKSGQTGLSTVTVGKSSFQVKFVDTAVTASRLRVEHDGYFQKNIPETIKITAVDDNGNPTPTLNFPGVISLKAEGGEAHFTPSSLEMRNFTGGVAEIKMTADEDGSLTIRAQNGALVGISPFIRSEEAKLFSDIPSTHPNRAAIKYPKDNNIAGGYPDGTFKPDKTVNRAEALKMLMLAFNVQVGVSPEPNFSDVPKNAWFLPTLKAAVAKGIVKGYPDGTFRPDKTVNRAEYLKILFTANSIVPNAEITKPYNDVDLSDWFAGYAFLANKMNLLSTGKNLRPDDGMTRADVAETIYRMKMIQKNSWVAYVK